MWHLGIPKSGIPMRHPKQHKPGPTTMRLKQALQSSPLSFWTSSVIFRAIWRASFRVNANNECTSRCVHNLVCDHGQVVNAENTFDLQPREM
jgi:hypothetical protein